MAGCGDVVRQPGATGRRGKGQLLRSSLLRPAVLLIVDREFNSLIRLTWEDTSKGVRSHSTHECGSARSTPVVGVQHPAVIRRSARTVGSVWEDRVGRRRAPIAPCDESLRTLVVWLRARTDERALPADRLALRIGCDPSWLSRGLSGRRVPPWTLAEEIAVACGGSVREARTLWDAVQARFGEEPSRPVASGYPPVDITDYCDLREALRALVDERVPSQRQLVTRDESGILCRSTVGAVLRGQRSASREVTLAIVRACGVCHDATAEWATVWDRVGRPFRERMDHERRLIAHYRLRRASW
jgi:hypothetical protein